MQKQNLTQASRELFRRAPDERFASLDDLWRHCQDFKERSTERWHCPAEILTAPMSGRLDLMPGGDGEGYPGSFLTDSGPRSPRRMGDEALDRRGKKVS